MREQGKGTKDKGNGDVLLKLQPTITGRRMAVDPFPTLIFNDEIVGEAQPLGDHLCYRNVRDHLAIDNADLIVQAWVLCLISREGGEKSGIVAKPER